MMVRLLEWEPNEELLKQCEVYQEIYYSQFKKTEDEKEKINEKEDQ